MTNEQINKEIKKLRAIIKDAEDEIKTYHSWLKENSPIQPGDRVSITTPAHKGWRAGEWIQESTKIGECVEVEINTYWDTDDDYGRPVYHPITKAGVVAKVGRFTAGKDDKVEKI